MFVHFVLTQAAMRYSLLFFSLFFGGVGGGVGGGGESRE